MTLYPLLLKAHLTDYLWGGRKLIDEYGFEAETDIAAEAWVLSCHKDGMNTVLNGALAGKTLPEVLSLWGDGALGKNAAAFPYFPLLIKLIDARDRLSVQVHPDDEFALENEGEFGKTEMWYVVDCEEGAELIYGFNRTVSKAELEQSIRSNTLPSLCNRVPVRKGDVFFIAAGTLHAIGSGILIAEVQQNSNTTYRVSDYGRLGTDGKPRALHIEKALQVTGLTPPDAPYGSTGAVSRLAYGSVRGLAQCELFTCDLLNLNGSTVLENSDSFTALLVLDGNADIIWADGKIAACKGACVFVPAGFSVTLDGQAEILLSRV